MTQVLRKIAFVLMMWMFVTSRLWALSVVGADLATTPVWLWHVLNGVVVLFIMFICFFIVMRLTEKRIEERGRRHTRRLASFLHDSRLSLWVYDIEHQSFRWYDNNGVEQRSYTMEQMPQRVGEENFERLMDCLGKVERQEKVEASVELSTRSESNLAGGKRTYVLNASVLRRKHGSPSLVIVVCHDVTEERQKQLQNQKSLICYRSVFNTAVVDMVYYDEKGYVVDMNKCAQRNSNVTLEKAIAGKANLHDYVEGLDFERFDCFHATMFFGNDIPASLMQETPLIYEMQLVPVRRPDGSLSCIYGTGRNVTEVVLTYHALRNSIKEVQKANRDVVAYMENINFVLGVGGIRLVRYSLESHMLTVYRSLDAIQLQLSQSRIMTIIDEQSRKRVMRMLHNMDNRTPTRLDEYLKTTLCVRGMPFYLRLCFVPIFDDNHQVTGYFGLCRDVSEIKATEALLEKERARAQDVENLKNSFLRNMSYEIRTPLNAVVGFAELFDLEHSPEDEEVFIKEIKDNSAHLLHLINDILFLSRLDAHMIEMECTEVDFAETFETHCRLGWNDDQKEGVDYIIENRYEHLVIEADDVNIGRIIRQITANAAQHTESGSVRARYDYVNGRLIIVVEDTGSGISKDTLSRIYERFAIVGNRGTGLGMPICKELADQLGGTIDINTKEGEGTIVGITVPCKLISVERKKEVTKANGPSLAGGLLACLLGFLPGSAFASASDPTADSISALVYICLVVVFLMMLTLFGRTLRQRVQRANMKAVDLKNMMEIALLQSNYSVFEYDVKTNWLRNTYGTMLPDGGCTLKDFLARVEPGEQETLMKQIEDLIGGNSSNNMWELNGRWIPLKRGVGNDLPDRIHIHGYLLSETNRNGDVETLVFTVRDMTEEYEEEEKAAELSNRFKNMFESTMIAMSFYDKDGMLLDLNNNMRELCGFEEIGEKYYHSTCLFDFPMLADDFDPDSRENFYACHRMRHANGSSKYIEFRVKPTYENDELQFYVVTARDVTHGRELYLKLHRQNMELQENNKMRNRYETELNYLLEESITWVWRSDLEKRNIVFSRSLRKDDFVLSFEELIDLLYDDQKPLAMEAFGNMEGSNTNFNVTLHFKKTPTNDSPQWETVVGIPVVDKDTGQLKGHFGIIRNVTALLDAQEQLKREASRADDSSKLKSAFLANMTHEIRTPLNAIVGFSDLLQVIDTPEERSEFLRIIRNNCDMLIRLINDIIEASSMDQGSLSIETADVDFAVAFNDICQTLSQRVQDPGVEFIIDNPYDTFPTCVDKGRLQQVITNFTTNAVKYTRKGHIKVGYRYEDGGIYMYCEDTGAGIPKDKQGSVFERFVKLDDFVQGTGLGLSICKSIADRCHGRIGVDSEGEGRGSTFWIWVPCERL